MKKPARVLSSRGLFAFGQKLIPYDSASNCFLLSFPARSLTFKVFTVVASVVVAVATDPFIVVVLHPTFTASPAFIRGNAGRWLEGYFKLVGLHDFSFLAVIH
jgi:hypothetical protein